MSMYTGSEAMAVVCHVKVIVHQYVIYQCVYLAGLCAVTGGFCQDEVRTCRLQVGLDGYLLVSACWLVVQTWVLCQDWVVSVS